MHSNYNPKIGIAIPCYNNINVLRQSIPPISNSNYFITIFDDNSTDGTEQYIVKNYPDISYLKGDGTNWWTGSIKKAIDNCLHAGCEYILSLNADVVIEKHTITRLMETCKLKNHSVIASLVVKRNNIMQIGWAGSKFYKLPFLPIYTSKYILKAGTTIPDNLVNVYEVDEVHGRGVIFHKSIFNDFGIYDYKTFPHYGGDMDFSLRLRRKGVKLYVDPNCRVKVFFNNTGFLNSKNMSFSNKLFLIRLYLFNRKNGEAFFVWWKLLSRHVPSYAVLPSFLFNIILNIFRKL